MKKNGYSDYTIENYGKSLDVLAKHCNLDEPETIKSFLATLDSSHGYKKQLVFAYEKYCKTYGLTWERPKYIPRRKMPKIPHEAKINYIIANASPKLRSAISISKDTGLRPIELMRLKLRDIDLQKRAVYPETAKHGNPRALKITEKTLHMLTEYLARANIKPNQQIFANWKPVDYSKYFRATRNKTAKKMADPTIRTIRLYDLRHFFATMLYHRTKDILFVKQQMGHKNIETTLIYTQLLQFENEDEWTCKVAQNPERATQLIENGFEYIATTPEGLMLFRKRK
ncbi:MAG: site-specific integrase [Candidatus Bathyarchaeota archaeon]|nr:MAG: site-specific integrase [Candidatus Bathyarchaeota archaeon]